MSYPLTQKELDMAKCGEPDCQKHDHSVLFFSSRCHPKSKTCEVCYVKETGNIVINCGICGKLITEVQVAA